MSVQLTQPQIAEHILYPESDGQPMGETDLHRQIMTAVIAALEDRYRDEPEVYVSGNLSVYYEKGDPTAVFAPDAFVVFGVPKHVRRTYKLWEEGQKGPDVVFEITSESSSLDDEGKKKVICRRLGVREYFLFDPQEEYLDPPLQGFRLDGFYYMPIRPDENGQLYSELLDVYLRRENRNLRLIDAQTGEKLLTPQEAQEARRQAEAEVARLQAELNRLRQNKE